MFLKYVTVRTLSSLKFLIFWVCTLISDVSAEVETTLQLLFEQNYVVRVNLSLISLLEIFEQYNINGQCKVPYRRDQSLKFFLIT